MTRSQRTTFVAMVLVVTAVVLSLSAVPLPGGAAAATTSAPLPPAAPNVAAAAAAAALPGGVPEQHATVYDTYYLPFDTPIDEMRSHLAFLESQGVNLVYLSASEADVADGRKMANAITAGHELGLQVFLNPYIGGTFSGDEGFSALNYVAAHPGDVARSRTGEIAERAAIDAPGYEQYLKDNLTALLAHPFDGLILDEPQYPVASVPGDYYPYDPFARQQFAARFGHPMPATETAEVGEFRKENMRAFLDSLFVHALTVRPSLYTELVVLPYHFNGDTRLGTEDWTYLSAMTSIDAFQTDPYWGPSDEVPRWDWYVANVDRLVQTVRPGLARGIWQNAFDLRGDGSHLVRAFELARSAGVEQLLAWQSLKFPNDDDAAVWRDLEPVFTRPFGSFDEATRLPGGVRVRGWAIDPDVATPTGVHVYVDGAGAALGANVTRNDVGTVYPSWGSDHGFDAVVPVPPSGTTAQVCAYALDAGQGDTNLLLGCRTVVGSAPFGNIDEVSRQPGAMRLRGWAIDPDSTNATTVHAYVNGVGWAILGANQSRLDVGAAFPPWGAAHGFDAVVPVNGADAQVCLYAINLATGTTNTLLGCRTVIGSAPIGNLDEVSTAPGGARVRGWAIDPDTVAATTVHVYVDGRGRAVLGAGTFRGDIATAFPAWGGAHGFDAVVPVNTGERSVCAYAINVAAGSTNSLLGCRSLP